MKPQQGIYWLASYPKSGNTWLRMFLSNLQKDQDIPVDINDSEGFTSEIASSRWWIDDVLGFDTADLYPDEVNDLRPEVYQWSATLQPGVTYHKIHDAYLCRADGTPLVSQEATLGAVYIVRNPLDVVTSAANHWHCSVDQAITHMGNREVRFARSHHKLAQQLEQRLLDWSGHVVSWIDAPDLSCLVIRYEDLLQNASQTFARVARFLNLTDEPRRVDKAIRFSSFHELSRQEAEKNFREKPHHMARFFNQGRSGVWREQLTHEQVNRIVTDHGIVMGRLGYLDRSGNPL